MKKAGLLRMGLVVALVAVLAAPAVAAAQVFNIDLAIKVKAKGVKARYFETATLTFLGDGTFTTDDIKAGTWTGDERKRVLQIALADIETLIEEVAAAELGTTLELVSVRSQKGKAKIKRGIIKGSLKIKGIVDAPDLGLFGVKFSLMIKFTGSTPP